MISFSACTHRQLIQDKEYDVSQKLFSEKLYSDAYITYPHEKEPNGFISSFEKNWISFWADQDSRAFQQEEGRARLDVRIQQLEQLVQQIDDRKVTKLTTEAGTFLFGEAEDGYNPSEHEILTLYLFLSMNYIQAGHLDLARIYVRRAADFLDGNPEGKEKKFDDAAIRLWMAGLWSQLGENDFAQVNLRVANQLQPNQKIQEWLQQQKKGPLSIVFQGRGPRTQWNEYGEMTQFVFETPLHDPQSAFAKTDEWFLWHQKRNTSLRETLIKSNYMMNSIGIQSARGLKKTSAVLLSAPLYVLSVAVFVGGTALVIYAAAQSGGGSAEGLGYIFAGVLIASKGIFSLASKTFDSINQSSERDYQNQVEQIKTYRMFRYLPSAVGLEEMTDKNGLTWKKENFVFK